MATHSSILAWRIQWTEEPGGLQSTGSQKSQTRLKTLSLFKLFNRYWTIRAFWLLLKERYAVKMDQFREAMSICDI